MDRNVLSEREIGDCAGLPGTYKILART